MPDFVALRNDFGAATRRIYLDSAAKSILPAPVHDRLSRYFAFCCREGRDYGGWWKTAGAARAGMARLLGASPAEIAFCSSSTHAINIIAQGLAWKPGDNLVVAEEEFPSNVYPWLALIQRGVEIRFVPFGGGYPLGKYHDLVDRNTRLISVSHVQANCGFQCDLDEMGAYCAKNDILFLVDATQSCGVVPIDVKRSQVDFLCASTYKWLLGIDGMATLYIAAHRLPSVGFSYLGWAGRSDPNDYSHHRLDYPDEARRFELGNPNFTAIQALDAGIDYLAGIGVEHVHERVMDLVDRLKDRLRAIPGLTLVGDYDRQHTGPIVTASFLKSRVDNALAHETLLKRGVVTSLKPLGIRFSVNFYNTPEDIECACDCLRDIAAGK